jgi:hypothetical protein
MLVVEGNISSEVVKGGAKPHLTHIFIFLLLEKERYS